MTIAGLINALAQSLQWSCPWRVGPSAPAAFAVSGGMEGDEAVQLTFTFDFEKTFVFNLDFGGGLQALGMQSDPATVGLTLGIRLDVSVGLDLDGLRLPAR